MNDISINLQAIIEGRILLYVFLFAFCAALVSSSCDLINTNTHLLHTEDISKVVKDYKQFCKQSTQCMKTPSCWILSNPCIHTNDRGINTLYKGMQTNLIICSICLDLRFLQIKQSTRIRCVGSKIKGKKKEKKKKDIKTILEQVLLKKIVLCLL